MVILFIAILCVSVDSLLVRCWTHVLTNLTNACICRHAWPVVCGARCQRSDYMHIVLGVLRRSENTNRTPSSWVEADRIGISVSLSSEVFWRVKISWFVCVILTLFPHHPAYSIHPEPRTPTHLPTYPPARTHARTHAHPSTPLIRWPYNYNHIADLQFPPQYPLYPIVVYS